jgi:hypothetical protein
MAVKSVRGSAAFVVATTLTLAACANSGSVVRTASGDGASTLPPNASGLAERLDAKTAETAGAIQHSAIVTIAGRATAVLSVQNGLSDRRVQVLVDQNGWQAIATLRLPEPRFDLDGTRDIEIDDVTGDDIVDFLVPLTANHNSAVLVSNHTGRWELVPFVGIDGETVRYVEVDPHLVDHAMTSMDRICVPNCAQGGQAPVRWTYSDNTMIRVP